MKTYSIQKINLQTTPALMGKPFHYHVSKSAQLMQQFNDTEGFWLKFLVLNSQIDDTELRSFIWFHDHDVIQLGDNFQLRFVCASWLDYTLYPTYPFNDLVPINLFEIIEAYSKPLLRFVGRTEPRIILNKEAT